MKRSLILAAHEIQLFLVDSFDILFSLLLPIAVFTLMYFGFSGNSMFNGTANIVNLDTGGEYATELLDRLAENDNIDIRYYTEDEADIRLERSDITTVLYIPENFSGELEAGGSAELIFKQRGNGGQEGQIIASIVGGIADEINLELQTKSQVSTALSGTGIAAGDIETVVTKYIEDEKENPVVGVEETTIGSSPDVINQFLPGVVNMFVLFSLTMSARAIVEERKRGTLERLLTSRISIGEMFAGKFMANTARGFIQTVILLGLAYAVFQIFTPLSFLTCLLIALVFSAAAGSIGLIIATVARSEDAAVWIAVFFTMAMVMLGGTFFEIPDGSVLYTISQFSIITYANEAFRTVIAESGTLADIGMQLVILAGVFVAGIIISRIMFKIIPGGR